MSIITVVHTGDMHNRLTRAKAEKLRELRRGADLLLDSGDAAGSGNIFFNVFGEYSQKLMNRAGYDAAAVGNREYHFNRFGMACKLKNARFPFVSANFCWSEGRMFEEYETFRIGDCDAAVFGLSNVNISEDMRISRYSHQYQTDPLERAEKILIEIEQQPTDARERIIIALTHVGLEKDKEIARLTKGRIAVILGGHSHDTCHGTVCGTHIIHSGCRCGFATRFSLNTETKNITALERIEL